MGCMGVIAISKYQLLTKVISTFYYEIYLFTSCLLLFHLSEPHCKKMHLVPYFSIILQSDYREDP